MADKYDVMYNFRLLVEILSIFRRLCAKKTS